MVKQVSNENHVTVLWIEDLYCPDKNLYRLVVLFIAIVNLVWNFGEIYRGYL